MKPLSEVKSPKTSKTSDDDLDNERLDEAEAVAATRNGEQ